MGRLVKVVSLAYRESKFIERAYEFRFGLSSEGENKPPDDCARPTFATLGAHDLDLWKAREQV